MENQPIVRLNFTCNRNWDDMTAVTGGRFCNDCQKKVVDFTDKTNEEIAAYLISSTTQVCGRFQNLQLASAPPKPIWKRWFSAAAMFAAVFIGIKEASGQTIVQQDTFSKKDNEVISYGGVGIDPSFSGGEKAFDMFLHNNIHSPKGVSGRIIVAFTVEKDGSLTEIRILRGLGREADEEAMRVLQKSPKWKPGIQAGGVVKTAWVMPINFGK